MRELPLQYASTDKNKKSHYNYRRFARVVNLKVNAGNFSVSALNLKECIFLNFCVLMHSWVLGFAMTSKKSGKKITGNGQKQILPFWVKFALKLVLKSLISSARCVKIVYYWNITIQSHEILTIVLKNDIIKGP